MNALHKALAEIKFQIPPEVLQVGFVENFGRVNQVVSLDERIMNGVIRPRVLVDANLVGGVVARVPIAGCMVREYLPYEYIVIVPKELTSGRSIVSVLSLVSYTNTITTAPVYTASPMLTAANNMFNSITQETVIQTSRLELIGDNTVLIQDPNLSILTGSLRCTVEYDETMSAIHPRNMHSFSKLCVLATKSYIYNNCKVKLDQGYVYGGHELGSISEVIDSYSDAEEQYQEFLNSDFRIAAFINTGDNVQRLVQSMLGNTL